MGRLYTRRPAPRASAGRSRALAVAYACACTLRGSRHATASRSPPPPHRAGLLLAGPREAARAAAPAPRPPGSRRRGHRRRPHRPVDGHPPEGDGAAAPRWSCWSARPRPTGRAAATPGSWATPSTTRTAWPWPTSAGRRPPRLATLGRENVADLAGLPGHPRHRLRPGAHGHPARGARLPPARRPPRGRGLRAIARHLGPPDPRRRGDPGPPAVAPLSRRALQPGRAPPSIPSSWWTASPARPSGEGSASSSTHRSPASRRRSAGLRLRTPRGEVVTRRAVQATSAYSHELRPALRHRFIPLYDYVLVSEPLRAEQRAALGWRGREGVTDVRTFFNYYRLTADDRVLWGTSEAAYYSGNRVDADLRPLGAPLPRAAGELRPPLPRPGRPRVPLRLGRAHLRDHAHDPVLRQPPIGAASSTAWASPATASAPPTWRAGSSPTSPWRSQAPSSTSPSSAACPSPTHPSPRAPGPSTR